MNQTEKLPIGIEDFKKMRTEGFYYVDKTGLITELLDNWGEVNLFTRPRRFGKSLNMSMLKYFFEMGDNRALFLLFRIERYTVFLYGKSGDGLRRRQRGMLRN